MQSKKNLLATFESAKGNVFYNIDDFQEDAKNFLKDTRNRKIVTSMHVSASGMTRKFNVDQYNMLLNICYNQKKTWDVVKVTGCGMDMWWNLLYVTCSYLATKKEQEKWGLNGLCSDQKVL